jgi:N-methylhydantoinase A
VRRAVFPGLGAVDAPVFRLGALVPDSVHAGPSIVETPFTSIVIDAGARFQRRASGSLVVDLKPAAPGTVP